MTTKTDWQSVIDNLSDKMRDPNLSDEEFEKLKDEYSEALSERRKEDLSRKNSLNEVVAVINKHDYTLADILSAVPKVHSGFGTGAQAEKAPSTEAVKAVSRKSVVLPSDARHPFLIIPRGICLSKKEIEGLHNKVHDVAIRIGRTGETYLKTNKMFGSLPQPLQRIVDQFDSATDIEAELTKHVVDNESAKTYASSEPGQQEIKKLAEFLAKSKKTAQSA